MRWCRNTIKLKCTSSYPVMNSLLSTCSQLHQPRLYMHFFSQTILIHQVRINITINRFMVNQNRNNLTTELTFHLNNGCLVICLLVVHSWINLRNATVHIPNWLCLLNTIDLRPSTLVQWKILLAMFFAIDPTLQWSSIITSILLLSRLWPMSLLKCIKLLVRNDIFFLTYILISSLLQWSLPFNFLIPL